MEYRLEIYGPSGYEKDDCIKVFSSTTPFLPFHVGDLLDASSWGHMGSHSLRVLSVNHAIVEKPALGIDPSGNIIHRALIRTEGVLDKPRHKAPAALYRR
jgi:hypothetical protein